MSATRVLVVIAAALVMGCGAWAAGDDDLLVPLVPPPGLARWGAVPAWKGTFRAVWHQRQVQNHGNGGEDNEDQIVDGTVFLDQQTNLGHPATTGSGGPRASIWHGWAKASIRIQKLDIQKGKNGQVYRRDEASGEGLAGADCDLQIDAVRGTFILHVRQLRIDMQYTSWEAGRPPVSHSRVGTHSVELSAGSMHGVCGLGSGSLPESGLELSQTAPYDYTSNDGRVSTGTYSYSLHPVGELPKVELVVDSPAYDAWRPEAGPDEKTIGNEIKFDAKLQNPDGSEANVKAVKILFELIDTSREPGIAMNFPVTGAGKDCDLQFSPKSNPPDPYILSGTGNQRAETVPGEYSLSDLGSSLNLQHLTKQIRGLPQGAITPQSQPKTLDRHAHRCRSAGVQLPARSHDTTLRPAQFSRVAPWPAILPTIPGPRQSLFIEY